MGLEEIKIEGNEWEIDSFAACVAAIMKLWKRDYNYQTIAGLSGTAFSPIWWVGEDCGAWWMEFGNDIRVKFLGKALGFYLRESPFMDHEEYEKLGEPTPELKEFWADAKKAVDEGKPVIVRTWPTWSIITEWNDDFEKMRLAKVDGPVGDICKVYPFSKAYILSEGPAEMTRMDAYREAIVFGADIADGTFQIDDYKYGGALYDAIINAMGEECFCPSCGDESCGCVSRTMSRITGTNSDAAKFLEEASMFMGSQLPKTELVDLIKKYQSLSEAGTEYRNYKTMCDNWDKEEYQTAYTAKILEMKVTHSETAGVFRSLVTVM